MKYFESKYFNCKVNINYRICEKVINKILTRCSKIIILIFIQKNRNMIYVQIEKWFIYVYKKYCTIYLIKINKYANYKNLSCKFTINNNFI